MFFWTCFYDDTALHRAVRKGNDKAVKLLLAAGADPTLQTGHDEDDYPTPLKLVKNKLAYWSLFKTTGNQQKHKLTNIEMMLTTCVCFWETSNHACAGAGLRSGEGRKVWDNKCIDSKGMKEAFELTVAGCDWSDEGVKTENDQQKKSSQNVTVFQNKSHSKVFALSNGILPKTIVYCRCSRQGAFKCSTKSCVRCCTDRNCERHQQ